MNISKKIAVVTGGASGLGLAASKILINAGATVVIFDMNASAGAQAVADLGSKSSHFVQLDVSSGHDVEVAFKRVLKDFGQVDICVNCAGIGIAAKTVDREGQPHDLDLYRKVIEVNLKSVFNMTKAVQRPLLKKRSGSIIHMSSVVGVKGNAGQTNYAASKAGLIGFTKSVAAELGSRNIRCNAIAPGFIETEMTEALDQKVVAEWRNGIPLKRGGSPMDVSNATVFLASDMSAYITGQTIHVCGGMLM